MFIWRKRFFFVCWLITAFVVCGLPAFAKGDVTLDRIFREHKIHIVTTESPDDISKYLFRLRINAVSIMYIPELLVHQGQLKDEDSILFLVDRKKARRLIAEEDRLLPCPTSAIESDQVVLYVEKARGRNGWDIIVSAPNEKWLHWELERLCDTMLPARKLEERGVILDRYKVKRLQIISNEGKQIAEDWVSRQLKPGHDTIDWDFISTTDCPSRIEEDTLFLINKAKLSQDDDTLKHLPQALIDWLANPENDSEWAAEACRVHTDDGYDITVAAVAAPCERHLSLALNRYDSFDDVPEVLQRDYLTDLSGYTDMIVIARWGDRNGNGNTAALDDLAGKMTASLSSLAGFRCVSRQDLKELIYMALLHGRDGNLDTGDLVQIKQRADGARALAIVDLAALDTRTEYRSNSPYRITKPYPPFSEPEPVKPSKPDPDARKFGFFGGHIYDKVDGSRENDPDYIRDYKQWKKDVDEWEWDYRRWKSRREDYEESRYYHNIQWELSIDSVQMARVTGNLRIYDLSDITNETAGQVLFTCPLDGEDSHTNKHWSDYVMVRGEHITPPAPDAPQSREEIENGTIVSEAFRKACDRATKTLIHAVILPSDRVVVTIAEDDSRSEEQ